MIISMTGFARSEANSSQGRLIWEVRSVNHRYLDIQLRLPEGFRTLEPQLRKIAGKRVRRGKIDCTLTVQQSPDHVPPTVLNIPFAEQLIAHAESLSRRMAESRAIDPVAIMRWPGVVQEDETDVESLFEAAAQSFAQAMDGLLDSRGREGERIQEMLRARGEEIDTAVSAIRNRLPAVLEAIQQKLRDRVRALADNADPERLETEIALLAQKLDVSEELDRLQAHVAELENAFTDSQPVGRRLDFLMQEFNREANTLASKSGDTATTRQAIELKVLIEQMREQIQNVE